MTVESGISSCIGGVDNGNRGQVDGFANAELASGDHDEILGLPVHNDERDAGRGAA